MIWSAAVGVSVIGGVVHGAFHRNSPIFGRALGRIDSDRKVVALTFDDGPNPDATPRILDTLGEKGVRATFFVLGSHAERWPELVRRMSSEGHQLGNHGYFHRKLQFKSPFYVSRDIRLGIRAIRRAGAPAPRYFRAPHGFRSPWTTPIASSYGERTVGWSLGVWDSDRPGVNEIVRRTIEGVTPGSIVLLHDGDGYNPDGDRMQTAAALPHIIDRLTDQGYEFATLPTE
ncbi:MAG TPA: polysaccharide deacetylase family protein [Gemmatimonadaceae bacterium]|jgi:peptidoglycan/xylan/chitin deacetylase (PgdA/CDA1 family)|nr:polysaccharide deacetylase family protein [Gemmatimonadaceae bacterium]